MSLEDEVIKIFEAKEFELPLCYKDNKEFSIFLKEHFSNYLGKMIGLNILSQKDLKNLKDLINCINLLLKNYYNGKIYLAYDNLYKTLKKIESYLLIREFDGNSLPFFFRARVGDNNSYSKKEMFHIPFSKRTLVNSYRYSIAGHPTLYLGKSLYVCWNEMRRPEFQKLNIVRYALKDNENIRLLDFGYRPQDIRQALLAIREKNIDRNIEINFIDDLADFVRVKKNLINYLVTYPLLASCSVKVKNDSDPFKPEYIIPQGLLQYIMKSNGSNNKVPKKQGMAEYSRKNINREEIFEDIHGVRYFSVSTDYKKYSTPNVNPIEFIHNYALPAFSTQDSELCKRLLSKFESTEPISCALLEIAKPQGIHSSLSHYSSSIEIMRNHSPIEYKRTKFYEIENYLLQSYVSLSDIV